MQDICASPNIFCPTAAAAQLRRHHTALYRHRTAADRAGNSESCAVDIKSGSHEWLPIFMSYHSIQLTLV